MSHENAFGNFILTLDRLGITDASKQKTTRGKIFHFMRMMEFDFCDKWGINEQQS